MRFVEKENRRGLHSHPPPLSPKKFRCKSATHRNQACLNVNFLREFKQSLRRSLKTEIQISG